MNRYIIQVQGYLDARWADWMAPLTIEYLADGTTNLSGDLPDQAALYGLLQKIRDLNLTLLAVMRVTPPSRDARQGESSVNTP